MITIRELAQQDYDTWKTMYLDYSSVWNEDMNEVRIQKTWKMLTDPNIHAYGIIAIDNENNAVGFACYATYPNTYSTSMSSYLHDLYTKPQLRGKGIAKTLLDYLTDKGKKDGWRGIHWRTRPTNEVAINFYSKIAKRSEWVFFDKILN